MKKSRYILLALVSIVLLIGLDQYTKHLAVIHLYQQEPIVIIPGVFELHFLVNHGAAFGILQNQQLFFIVMTTVVMCLLTYIFLKIPMNRRYHLLHGILVLLFAGAVGNWIDRLINGYVVDFFYFKLIDFPIFNVADCYVVISVFLFFIVFLFYYKDDEVDQIFDYLKPVRRRNG
ncbi:MAG: signal peptidase II [Lachnospiraceae bacterium]|nr:signal peptidase II [Lachnospiraceae bacterium]